MGDKPSEHENNTEDEKEQGRIKKFLRFLSSKTRWKLGIFGFILFGVILYVLKLIVLSVHQYISGIQAYLQSIHPFFSLLAGYGISLVLFVLTIYLIGFLVEKSETNPMFTRCIKKIPLLNKLWKLFLDAKHTIHNINDARIVEIRDFPCQGSHTISFITGKTCRIENGIKKFYPRVGPPNTPNALPGQPYWVERNKLVLLDMPYEEFVKNIALFTTSGPKEVIVHPHQEILDSYYKEDTKEEKE